MPTSFIRSTMECFQSSFSEFFAAMSLRTAATSTCFAGAVGATAAVCVAAAPNAEGVGDGAAGVPAAAADDV